jgi:uncharacterized protein (TIGR02271 family)
MESTIMALVKMETFYPDYKNDSDAVDLKNFDVYAEGNDKVGSINDVLVDAQTGQLRYFVIDTGFWVFGKKVLLPVGRANVDSNERRIYAQGLTKQQVEHLPNFKDLEEIDYDYEEQVRGVYRPTSATGGATAATAGAATTPTSAPSKTAAANTYDRNTYGYDEHDSELYGLNRQDQQSLKLYEERLIANKTRQKTGEVTIGKHVETETMNVAVPIEKERVVIERSAPSNQAVTAGEATFQSGEVAHMDVYEETPDIHKEAFVREEVKVRKEVQQDTVTAEETLRREELDLKTDGQPPVNR